MWHGNLIKCVNYRRRSIGDVVDEAWEYTWGNYLDVVLYIIADVHVI